MNFAKLALVLPLVFLVLFADKSCDIDLGDIGDYVVKYDITITNASSQEARVTLYGTDVNSTAVAPPGGALETTAYMEGTITVYAEPAFDAVAELKARKADIEAQLAHKPISLTVAQQLYEELDAINKALQDTTQQHAGACFGKLHPTAEGKGQDYDFDVVFENNAFKVTGPGCAF